MREFQARKKRKKIVDSFIYSWWFLALLYIVGFLFLSGVVRIYTNHRGVSKEKAELEEKIKTLGKDKLRLENDLSRLKSDYGKDFEIRRKLDVQKPDEKVIKIIEN